MSADNSEKKRVLVVDDQQTFRDTIAFEFDLLGLEPVPACDGKDALEKFKGGDFDLVVSDIRMPNRTGVDLLEDIRKIEDFLKKYPVADFLKNRCFDIESGESKHLFGVDLDMAKKFDLKRLKQIKSYRGIRHTAKLPVRGQRTRAHFRGKGKAVGVSKKKLGKKS